MLINLYISTYVLAALFGVSALALLAAPDSSKRACMSFLRSREAAYVAFGAGIIWFLYILSQLGEADFGEIKLFLMAIFGGAGVLAFRYLPDFLSVRGVAVLALLACRFFLDSAYMMEPVSRLLLVSLSYIIVVAAMYFGAIPYRARDMFEWIYASKRRTLCTGAAFAVLAIALVAASIFY